jgi:hypothetical protein
MKRPQPPRTTVLSLVKGRQAKPMRGPQSVLSVKRKDSGIPASAAVMIGVGEIAA